MVYTVQLTGFFVYCVTDETDEQNKWADLLKRLWCFKKIWIQYKYR